MDLDHPSPFIPRTDNYPYTKKNPTIFMTF